MCNTLLVFGDIVTFAPPLYSDAGSYWCRNKTNHSDIAEAMLIFIGGHNCNQSANVLSIHIVVCPYIFSYILEVLTIMIIGNVMLHCNFIKQSCLLHCVEQWN